MSAPCAERQRALVLQFLIAICVAAVCWSQLGDTAQDVGFSTMYVCLRPPHSARGRLSAQSD